MAQYLHIDDNEDGTLTVSIKIGEQEIVNVIPMEFQDWVNMAMGASAVSPAMQKVNAHVRSKAVYIPNSPEEG